MVIKGKEQRASYLICYASQKGTAQSIAEEINEQSIGQGLKSNSVLSCISQIKSLKNLIKYACIIFVASTTGEGDPPDTAQQFMRQLRKEEKCQTSLSWLHYTILGLGDTNYTNFCNFGKTLDKCLQNLQAQRFNNCGWADDGVGLEIVVEPWLEGLFPSLRAFLDTYEPATLKLPNPDMIEFTDSTDSTASSSEKMKSPNPGNIKEDQPVPSPLYDLSALFPSLGLPSPEEINMDPVRKCEFGPEDTLSLPPPPSPFLRIHFQDKKFERSRWDEIDLHAVAPYPLARSEVIPCRVEEFRRITRIGAVKKALEVTLEPISGHGFDYEPGDSFGVVVENREVEVNLLLLLLGLQNKADLSLELSLDPGTQKRAAKLPKFIPSECSLRYAFTRCLDIRTVPKKLLLRALVDFTRDEYERRRLSEWASKEGALHYTAAFRTRGMTLLDLLVLFPSCSPPPSLLLEHLPRILPRPFSASSSPLVNPRRLSFVFNVVDIPRSPGVVFGRSGLCTGWLDELMQLRPSNPLGEDDLSLKMEALRIRSGGAPEAMANVPIYFRTNQMFRLPKNLETPLVMIGPGTGVAPFLGFLKHCEAQIKLMCTEDSPQGKSATPDALPKLPLTWLFFGCRHRNRDFLFRDELESMVQNASLTRLCLSFSRDESEDADAPKYVQDNLIRYGKEVVKWIRDNGASVYVCGDAQNMARNVQDTFINLFQTYLEMGEQDARKYLAHLQMEARYLQDVWT